LVSLDSNKFWRSSSRRSSSRRSRKRSSRRRSAVILEDMIE